MMDANAGMADQGLSLEEQTMGLRSVCPRVAPGGLCLWDCLFPHQEPAPRVPGDVYDTLRSQVIAMFSEGGSEAEAFFDKATVEHLTFIPGNAVLAKAGKLQPPGPDTEAVRQAILVRRDGRGQEDEGDQDGQDGGDEDDEL